MLAVERGASLVFHAHNPLKRCKVQLANRIVLITEQTLSSSKGLNRLGPDAHHLAAYERFDWVSSISGKSRNPSMACGPSSTWNCVSDMGLPPLVGVRSHRNSSRNAAFAHHDGAAAPQRRIAPGILRRRGITTE